MSVLINLSPNTHLGVRISFRLPCADVCYDQSKADIITMCLLIFPVHCGDVSSLQYQLATFLFMCASPHPPVRRLFNASHLAFLFVFHVSDPGI